MTNTIISIGYLGCYRNYLNVSREEAIKRYLARENQEELSSFERIEEIQIDDEWSSYDGASKS